ncbi:hypothetical protein [Acetobacterium woodii]|uniref:Prophage pi2 protein n=1 Tax=Acetobacterium woodii (strain ATCC 29683 / DSM 1030 / JCM 2381 / KCTC 1655 / WB1) TaxID=931626 RepID=H6LCB6_ACEWD|nr:hypothetical protein [Acetobacterium woodii]AFA50231.1 prophage pi2 protein [Acetobacterium woodii DSM 1030]
MWISICYLGIEAEAENAIGEKYEAVTFEDYVFCDQKSIRMSEFYQAATTDYKPSITLTLKQADYAGQRYIKFEDEVYTMIRTYAVDSEDIEVVLERGIKHGDASISDESIG